MGTSLNTAHDLLLRTHSALVQATTEQEITAAIALCADGDAFIRLLYLDLNNIGQPASVRMIASWRAGALWAADPLVSCSELVADECSLVSLLSAKHDPVYFAENIIECFGNLTDPCLMGVRALVALKLCGVAHIEQPSQWHGIVCIAWPMLHSFTNQEKYIYTSIWETASAVVSNHRLRLEALANVTRLKQLDRLKTSFLHGVSHELRTPLTALITITEGILAGSDGILNDELTTDVGVIHDEGEHLLALINDLLDMASIEAGKMKLYPEPFKLTDTVRQAVRAIAPLVLEKGLMLEDQLCVKLPIVFADKTRVRQVLFNLLSNAIKFTASGTIRIAAQQVDQRVILSVADSGIGIKTEDQAAIFNRFYRIDSPTARVVGGSGLGLPISKYLVEQNGGCLWVESEPGSGATFYFSIPIAKGIDESPLH